VIDDREHFPRHLHDDVVGVAVCEQARKGSSTRHPVTPGVVDDNDVDAAGFFALGRQSGACAASDDRDVPVSFGVQPVEDLCSGDS